MHPARKPLATLAITLGIFLVMLGAPALAGADDTTAPDLDASAIAQTKPAAEIAAADEDGDNAVGTDTDSTDGSADADGTDRDGTAVVGAGVAVAADSIAADSVAVSGDAVVGAGIAVAADSAVADGGTDTDGTGLVGTDQGGQNSNDGDNANSGQNGDNGQGQGQGAGNDGANDNGNATAADGGGEPSPAANDPVLSNNAGTVPAAASQGTDRTLPDAGGPASMMILVAGFGLVLAGVVVLSHGRVSAARHRAV